MSRSVRTARGAFGAFAATLLAAASHSIAGGTATPLGLIATAVIALPLCVLLAGRVGSLWRLGIAVIAAQFAYHWSFSGLGAVSTVQSSGSGFGGSAHESHLGLQNLEAMSALHTADLLSAGGAGVTMWVSHAVAAVATIALLHSGERAAMHLLRVLRSALPARLPAAVALPQRVAILAPLTERVSVATQHFLSSMSHRGPPRFVCP